MGEFGKRSRPRRDHDGDDRNPKRRPSDNSRDDAERDELVVYRILCPVASIGSVIGTSGKVINAIRQETRSKIKVVDPFPGSNQRVLLVYCYVKERKDVDVEDIGVNEKPLCAAQEALLRVHSTIVNADRKRKGRDGDSDKSRDGKEECRILVPMSQAGMVIGKAGSTINMLRSKTRTHIKITAKDHGDPSHSCAMDFDNFVQIVGDADGVRKALFAVSSIMYKFNPKESIPLETSATEVPPSIIIPSELPIYPPGGLYASADSIVNSRSLSSVLGTNHMQDLQGYSDAGHAWPLYSSALPVASGFGAAPRSAELAIRVLCPADKIGLVIGKGGATIKGMRQASGARIEVHDTKKDLEDRVINITSTEALDDQRSMAVEAVLLLQGKINNEDDDSVIMRILVPSKVIGCIIGKSGSIINEIRKRTKADIRISKGNKLKSDELIEMSGKVDYVKDALVQIVLRLRDDVLRDGDVRPTSTGAESFYPGGTSLSVPPVHHSLSQVAPLGYDQRAENGHSLGIIPSNNIYGYGSLPMGDNGYGSIPYSSNKHYGGFSPPTTLEISIPANTAGKVIGKGGANLANIRKISGAVVEISDSKYSRGDRIAHISGTPEQKHTAESLIHAFMMAA